MGSIMVVWVLLAGILTPADTVRIDVATALARGLSESPALAGALKREESATRRLGQAGAWPNPTVSLSAENVGQQADFTGRSGLPGLEGQAVATFPLPVGLERAGSVAAARARQSAASATRRLSEVDVRSSVLAQVSRVVTDEALAASSREELVMLGRVADALSLQADAGRASRGDAARATLARGLAATRSARREATLARSSAELARLIGAPASTVFDITLRSCSGLPETATAPAATPEIDVAAATVDLADAEVQRARGVRMPDLQPQIGIRRSGGRSGLFLGLTTPIPLGNLGREGVGAARADVAAARADAEDVEGRLTAARAAATRALAALEVGGEAFDGDWQAALDQTVTAAEARFRLGEGTLMELLDSRRARLEALHDHHRWRAEWWGARVDLARWEGRLLTDALLCVDPIGDTP